MTPLIAIGTIFDIVSLTVYSIQSLIDFETQLTFPFYYMVCFNNKKSDVTKSLLAGFFEGDISVTRSGFGESDV